MEPTQFVMPVLGSVDKAVENARKLAAKHNAYVVLREKSRNILGVTPQGDIEELLPSPIKAKIAERLAEDVMSLPKTHSRFKSALNACRAAVDFMDAAEAAERFNNAAA